jgi:Ataxin-3
MDSIFHEKQVGSLCAQHCLNSLLQGDFFTAIDLAEIGRQLDQQEQQHMAESGLVSRDYQEFLKQESSNYDDSGFFSIQVIQKALESFGLELVPFKSKNQIAEEARINPILQQAFICNFKEHWFTIRKIGGHWFNLNSIFARPQYVTNTYLSILLAQLANDGYSIFVVNGNIPASEADMRLETMAKEELLTRQNLLNQTESIIMNNNEDNDNTDDDNDLKAAIKMSLNETNKLENQASSYQTIVRESEQDLLAREEEELRKAIEMSLDKPDKEENPKKETEIPIKIENKPQVSETLEDIRQKRLEFFNRKPQ